MVYHSGWQEKSDEKVYMATQNDIVLVYLEDAPISFARIEEIRADSKKDWYHVKLLMLQVPLQVVTWILKNEYINGDEFFMGGKKMKLELVECPDSEIKPIKAPFTESQVHDDLLENKNPEDAKIISFADVKKSKTDYEPESG